MEWWLIPLILLAVIGAGWLAMLGAVWIVLGSYFRAEKRKHQSRWTE
jgi:hypothetical protein